MTLKSIYNRVVHYSFTNFGIPKSMNENISKKYITKYLPQNPVIIDCGSHYGYDSIEWASIIDCRIHAFEASPNVYKKLVEKTSAIPSIKTYPVALSDKNGKANFFISEGDSDGSSSLLEPSEHLNDHPDVHFNEVVEVDTITLDDWAKKNNISKVDMLWLDMQGFEMQMLKASTEILKTVRVIHTEVSVKETYEGVVQYPEFRNWLISAGFTPVLEVIPAGFDMGNVLFVRK